MKTKTIFKRKISFGLFFSAVLLTGIVGCQKGTFSVNDVNPNSPTSAPAKYSLSSSLAGTANLVQGGNADVLENWMGYWTQSGGYTPSTTYVIYQITSSNFTGNFDNAYLNLSNYNLLLKTVGADPVQANYRAIAMIMESYVYQRLVDLYNSVPYSQALIVNSTFSYKYDDPQTIYNSITAKCDSAVAIIAANSAKATSPGNYDVVFGGDMAKWTQFAKTLKLKLLMRQTEAGIGSAAVKAALASYKTSDFLSVDAAVNPGYSNASDAQENPFYYDVVATATGANGANTVYWRANSYGVNFFKNNNDNRGNYVYCPQGVEAINYKSPISDLSKIKGRDYGSVNGNGESNTVISAILGTGFTSAGVQKGPGQGALLIPASESLFLQAEAVERGYLAGTASTVYNAAVAASFAFLGAPGASDYTSQANAVSNYSLASDKIKLIVTQKWAAMNSIDPLESYSDWRRLGIPTDLPVSKYPGVTVTHIPYRLPYTINETTLNSANVPAGGGGNDLFTSKIFWMK
ncbi:SusD/RagB family nutrient-binding outer membrane lipoprotein [Mucilaginibacter flavus]|uniref:SusD/RagB family nutrient-binding outer membrane lipoprotein n=1 Tax=Mucilaginibacter flavus TaxID=931504 RepID=UPI0025B283CF|nr:SusD/RagB family nutrient-binding outer membrane lipoprotein [Mucilaginibacter flavus]MDN3582369.1 SusD/RagB family nutrient-binding outer membrane lipoprotein [Mucilaginibacter flavus]